MKVNKRSTALRVIIICITLIVKIALSGNFISKDLGLFAYTVLLLIYLYFEVLNFKRYYPDRYLLSPVVLSSLLLFLIYFGFSNIILIGREVTIWMNKMMFLVIFAAIAMWGGYSSICAKNLENRLIHSNVFRNLISSSFQVRKPVLFAFIACVFAIRLFQVSQGIYGYSDSMETIYGFNNSSQFIFLLESLGKLSLLCFAISIFHKEAASTSDLFILVLILIFEVVFGFLSGFKSAIVFPFIIVGFVFYNERKRIPVNLILISCTFMVVAYLVIEPYRALKQNFGITDNSIGGIAGALVQGTKSNEISFASITKVWTPFLARLNLTEIASFGIEYADKSQLPPESPQFLNNIFLSPIHAVVPRFIWSGKPLGDLGIWYNRVVLGHDFHNSVGMSPITYLYFAGGFLAVILGFLFLGILQRILCGFRTFGGGGTIIYFGLLNTCLGMSDSFNEVPLYFIRLLPLLIIVQSLILFRKRNPD